MACVNKWSQRFELHGLKGLVDLEGRGRKASIPLRKVQRVISEATRPLAPRTRGGRYARWRNTSASQRTAPSDFTADRGSLAMPPFA